MYLNIFQRNCTYVWCYGGVVNLTLTAHPNSISATPTPPTLLTVPNVSAPTPSRELLLLFFFIFSLFNRRHLPSSPSAYQQQTHEAAAAGGGEHDIPNHLHHPRLRPSISSAYLNPVSPPSYPSNHTSTTSILTSFLPSIGKQKHAPVLQVVYQS